MSNYANYMSNRNAPYGVVLGRTTDGWSRNVVDPRVAGIYQDIDVVPGSELVVNFISTSLAFSDGVAGAKLKISSVDQNQVLFDNRLNGMGSNPTGKLAAMVNIPNNMNNVRISFLPVSKNNYVSTHRSTQKDGYGNNPQYYYGGAVSDVRINSGAYLISKINQVDYLTKANSPQDGFARATVSLIIENKGHTQSKDTVYQVILPSNSKFISATGSNGSINGNIMKLNIGNLNPGEIRNITYTVDYEATRPKIVDLNGQVTYKTNAPFRGTDSQKNGDGSVDLQKVILLMNKTELETKVDHIEKS